MPELQKEAAKEAANESSINLEKRITSQSRDIAIVSQSQSELRETVKVYRANTDLLVNTVSQEQRRQGSRLNELERGWGAMDARISERQSLSDEDLDKVTSMVLESGMVEGACEGLFSEVLASRAASDGKKLDKILSANEIENRVAAAIVASGVRQPRPSRDNDDGEEPGDSEVQDFSLRDIREEFRNELRRFFDGDGQSRDIARVLMYQVVRSIVGLDSPAEEYGIGRDHSIETMNKIAAFVCSTEEFKTKVRAIRRS